MRVFGTPAQAKIAPEASNEDEIEPGALVEAEIIPEVFAQACGYENVYRAYSLDDLEKILSLDFLTQGPSLVHVKIAPGSLENLGRPNTSPAQVSLNF